MKEESRLVWSETGGQGLVDYIRCRNENEGPEGRLSIETYDTNSYGRKFCISTSQSDEGFWLSKEDMVKVYDFIGQFL